MLEHLLSLPCSMLEACRPTPDDAPEDGTFSGPLWNVKIPGSKPIIPFILDYARLQQTIHLDVNARRVATLQVKDQPTAGIDGLLVPYEAVDVYGTITKAVKSIPFLHPKAESLFNGEWTTFGPVQVKFDPDCILPTVEYRNGSAFIGWDSPPIVRTTSTGRWGWRQKISTTEIKHFRIGEFDGEVVTNSRLKNFFFPDGEWA
jgi:hypothetical protein